MKEVKKSPKQLAAYISRTVGQAVKNPDKLRKVLYHRKLVRHPFPNPCYRAKQSPESGGCDTANKGNELASAGHLPENLRHDSRTFVVNTSDPGSSQTESPLSKFYRSQEFPVLAFVLQWQLWKNVSQLSLQGNARLATCATVHRQQQLILNNVAFTLPLVPKYTLQDPRASLAFTKKGQIRRSPWEKADCRGRVNGNLDNLEMKFTRRRRFHSDSGRDIKGSVNNAILCSRNVRTSPGDRLSRNMAPPETISDVIPGDEHTRLSGTASQRMLTHCCPKLAKDVSEISEKRRRDELRIYARRVETISKPAVLKMFVLTLQVGSPFESYKGRIQRQESKGTLLSLNCNPSLQTGEPWKLQRLSA
ncbi:hypothetical protein ACRRTK_024100 [Alexandromys fortis]